MRRRSAVTLPTTNYGRNGSVAGMNVSAAQDVIGSADLGVGNQALRSFEGISGGGAMLS